MIQILRQLLQLLNSTSAGLLRRGKRHSAAPSRLRCRIFFVYGLTIRAGRRSTAGLAFYALSVGTATTASGDGQRE